MPAGELARARCSATGLDEAAIEAAAYGNAPGLTSAPLTWPQVLEGAVTVFEAFSVFNQQLRFGVGEKSFAFRPDARGGVLKFSLTLDAAGAR